MAATQAIPTNCAYGVFSATYTNANFDYSIGANLAANKVAITCRACKPKYSPTYLEAGLTGNQFGSVVTACGSITNCSSTG